MRVLSNPPAVSSPDARVQSAHLQCTKCKRTFGLRPYLFCPECRGALEYLVPEWAFVRSKAPRELGHFRFRDYFPLPAGARSNPVSLGEGASPLRACPGLGRLFAIKSLWIKDEGINPTGSWKDRPISLSVNCAREFGSSVVVVYSCGNAGSSTAAYAARCGMRSVVLALPTIKPLMAELIEAYGGTVVPLALSPRELWVEGRVGNLLEESQKELGWFPMTTVRYPYVGSPYYTEGYKSIAYEIFDDLERVPDWVVVPVGSGEGLIGIWNGFRDLRRRGVTKKFPKMVAVQGRGAAPLIAAYRRGRRTVPAIPKARTVASGIEVMVSSDLALEAVRDSSGCAIAVADRDVVRAVRELAALEGVYAGPEGAAAVVGARALRQSGRIRPGDCVVCISTASGLKYLGLSSRAVRQPVPARLEKVCDYVEKKTRRR